MATLVIAGRREAWQRARRQAWVLGPLLFFSAMGERTIPAVVKDSGARERLGPQAQRVVVGVGIARANCE